MISDENDVMYVDDIEDDSSQSTLVTQESTLNEQIDNENSNAGCIVKPPTNFQDENKTEVTCRLNQSDADDGQLCPICFDNWTSTGDHRICALKCGHLFGYSCINYWLSSQKEKNCPSCKKKVTRSEIRFIYARKLICVDNSELENMKKQMNKITEEKNVVQIELTKALCREHSIHLEVEALKQKVQILDKALQVKQHFGKCSHVNIADNSSIKLYVDKALDICKEAGCRVLTCFDKSGVIVVSMKSPSALFAGFGLRKIDVTSYKPTAYIPLHSKQIRDLKSHAENPLILSASLDKTSKIIDANSSMPVCVYNADAPLWCCCWDHNDPNIFYLGQQQGSTSKMDLRKLSEPICELKTPGDMSPVISIASTSQNYDVTPKGGIIVCKLNSLWAFKAKTEEYGQYPLPVEGPFTSMTFETETQQLLVSTRPNAQHAYTRHHLCYIENDKETDNLICRNIHCLQGSATQKYLSRSCFVSHNSEYYIAAHQETNKSVYLWDIKTGNRACYAPAPEPVLDICGINISNSDFVVSLTERKLMFYKFP